jgi:biopolymer transport protein ExbD
MLPNRLSRSSETPVEEVNINPINLIDVLFVIIIFLVLTNTLTQDTGVDVKKPQASSAQAIKDKTLKIAITREGTIHVHEKQVDFTTLEEVLRREAERTPDLKIIVVADDASQTGSLVKVLDKCNLAGLVHVSISALNEN